MFSAFPYVLLFVCTMFFGTLLSVTSSHWLMAWVGLEVNLMGFLPLLVYHGTLLESESGVKYFIVQSLGSIFLLGGSLWAFDIALGLKISESPKFAVLVIMAGLLIKLGAAPIGHFWVPSVLVGLSWATGMLLVTLQKVAPIFLMSIVVSSTTSGFLVTAAMLCALIGGLGGMNQTQIRALLAYSSVNHLSWILLSVLVSEKALIIYLSIYVLINILIFLAVWNSNIKGSLSLGNPGAMMKEDSFFLLISLLSLAGLPPLLGFLPKVVVISFTVSTNVWFSLFPLILGSLFSLFYYLSLMYSCFIGRSAGGASNISESFSKVSCLCALFNMAGGAALFVL